MQDELFEKLEHELKNFKDLIKENDYLKERKKNKQQER